MLSEAGAGRHHDGSERQFLLPPRCSDLGPLFKIQHRFLQGTHLHCVWAEVPGFILSIYTHTIPWVFLNARLESQLFAGCRLIIVPGDLPCAFARVEGKDVNFWAESCQP